MPLRDLLKKKDKIQDDEVSAPAPVQETKLPQASEFTFVRTDTHTEEVIQPPYYEGDDSEPTQEQTTAEHTTPPTTPERKRGLGRFRKSPGPSISPEIHPEKERRRLSQRLHITPKSRASSTSSANVPSDLPTIDDAYNESGDREIKEAKWEERATILATNHPGPSPAHAAAPTSALENLNLDVDGNRSGSNSRPRSISDAQGDANIQEAIRLHEAGGPENLTAATQMFGQLAEQGNVLSQVLYGLSLRHGWGIDPDPTRAVQYLSAAASNSASIESEALKAGMKKGGAAKGELVLAIFELANCFRNGWGVAVDKKAAREYYETAANLGDTDAMNEAAWCYLEGFGGKKDKVSRMSFFGSVNLCFCSRLPYYVVVFWTTIHFDQRDALLPAVLLDRTRPSQAHPGTTNLPAEPHRHTSVPSCKDRGPQVTKLGCSGYDPSHPYHWIQPPRITLGINASHSYQSRASISVPLEARSCISPLQSAQPMEIQKRADVLSSV
jgi:TPR repeat protein